VIQMCLEENLSIESPAFRSIFNSVEARLLSLIEG
jgi:hypothetical protein